MFSSTCQATANLTDQPESDWTAIALQLTAAEQRFTQGTVGFAETRMTAAMVARKLGHTVLYFCSDTREQLPHL